MRYFSRALWVAASFLLFGQSAIAVAQTSGQPIRIVYPTAAGSTGDLLVRVIANQLQPLLNQTILVDNRPGAGGQIGVVAVKQAPPDGTMFLVTPFAAMTLYPSTYKKLDYDPVRDFRPVTQLATYDMALAAGIDLPAKTLPELVVWLKQNPAKANFGTPGAGSLPHFFGILFGQQVSVPVTHVAYRGTGPAVTDLMGGSIPMVVSSVSDLVPLHKEGKIRLLATSDRQRSASIPDVPTFTENGVNLVGVGWYGMYAPAGTPDAVIDRMHKGMVAVLRSAEFQSRAESFGVKVTASSPAELAAIQKQDAEQWAPVIKASGFTAEQ